MQSRQLLLLWWPFFLIAFLICPIAVFIWKSLPSHDPAAIVRYAFYVQFTLRGLLTPLSHWQRENLPVHRSFSRQRACMLQKMKIEFLLAHASFFSNIKSFQGLHERTVSGPPSAQSCSILHWWGSLWDSAYVLVRLLRKKLKTNILIENMFFV